MKVNDLKMKERL